MNINWSVRIRNANFWLTIIPAVFLLIQLVASAFGYDWDFVALNEKATAVVNTVFVILTAVGVVNDPTTATLSDSERAMTYVTPFESDAIIDNEEE